MLFWRRWQIQLVYRVVQVIGNGAICARLQLADKFNELAVKTAAYADRGFQCVGALSFVGRANVRKIHSRCFVSSVIFCLHLTILMHNTTRCLKT